MLRRTFIRALASFVVAPMPLSTLVRTASAKELPVIGWMGATTPVAQKQWTDAFVNRLVELGWVDGKTIKIDYRWAEGNIERAVQIATQFANAEVAVIVTAGVGPTIAAGRATSKIPIVSAVNSDPLGSGLIKSLSKPAGNVTGISIQASDLAGKRIELLRRILPKLSRIAVLANAEDPGASLEMESVISTGRSLGLTTQSLGVTKVDEIASAIASADGRAEALLICADPFMMTNKDRVFAATQAANLPTMADVREFVNAGALLSYGPNFPDLFKRAAEYTDKILRGAIAGDLPVEQPTKFDLVLNASTARSLGITIPDQILAIADDVVE